jgi:protein-tyrosine phosphatase
MRHENNERAIKCVKNFKILREEAEKRNIELYLGNEILYSDETLELLKSKKIIALNKSKYLLIEFKRNENRSIDDIIEILETFIDHGYKPILAHPELYINYRNIKYVRRLKEAGIMLQMDGTSIVRGKAPYKLRKYSKKLLKERLIDVIASDTHCTKERDYKSLKKAYKIVSRIDKKYAKIIFYQNQLDILK